MVKMVSGTFRSVSGRQRTTVKSSTVKNAVKMNRQVMRALEKAKIAGEKKREAVNSVTDEGLRRSLSSPD